MTPKIKLGQTVHTPGIAALMSMGLSVSTLLHRHQTGDWGDMSAEDKAANDSAAENGGERVFSSYVTEFGKVWIITEADRSVTTVLLPDEY